jgi:phosphate transport system substrate-binding protein
MKTIKLTFILFFLLTWWSSCRTGNKQAVSNETSLKGNISLSGAFALYPITVKWADEFNKIHPDVKIDISAGGAGKGMADALSGMVDLGMFSRGISPQEIANGAWYIALTKDAVVPTLNADNPFIAELKKTGIRKNDLAKLYKTGEVNFWEELTGTSGKTSIRLYTRSDACGAAAMWAEFLGCTQEELKGVGVYGDPGLADAVRNDRFGLGFNNINYVYDINTREKNQQMEILPIDFNENGLIDSSECFYQTLDQINAAILRGDYPSPPARDLYFVSKGKPGKKEVVAFIEWILTEGQKFVQEAGYVPLSDEKLSNELKKLKE